MIELDRWLHVIIIIIIIMIIIIIIFLFEWLRPMLIIWCSLLTITFFIVHS